MAVSSNSTGFNVPAGYMLVHGYRLSNLSAEMLLNDVKRLINCWVLTKSILWLKILDCRSTSSPASPKLRAEQCREKIMMLVILPLINAQVQTSQQIQELRNMILQTSCGNRAVTTSLPNSLEADDAAQSFDSLLADDEGQELVHERPAAQIPVLNADQVFAARYMAPPPVADILVESVDSLMADDRAQEPGQEMSAAQVPIDEVYDDLEHTI